VASVSWGVGERPHSTESVGLYEQMRQLVFDDAPISFGHYETINYLTRKEIMGSTANPTLELRMANVWRNQ
jgi:hypothetical protein